MPNVGNTTISEKKLARLLYNTEAIYEFTSSSHLKGKNSQI